jgi:hypothetical protein
MASRARDDDSMRACLQPGVSRHLWATSASLLSPGDHGSLGSESVVPGLDPERRSYFTRASFADPDGKRWVLEEITERLPGV